VARGVLGPAPIAVDVIVIDREGLVVGHSQVG
jgi:hypothetical protein